jgi:hypothetical protein
MMDEHLPEVLDDKIMNGGKIHRKRGKGITEEKGYKLEKSDMGTSLKDRLYKRPLETRSVTLNHQVLLEKQTSNNGFSVQKGKHTFFGTSVN